MNGRAVAGGRAAGAESTTAASLPRPLYRRPYTCGNREAAQPQRRHAQFRFYESLPHTSGATHPLGGATAVNDEKDPFKQNADLIRALEDAPPRGDIPMPEHVIFALERARRDALGEVRHSSFVISSASQRRFCCWVRWRGCFSRAARLRRVWWSLRRATVSRRRGPRWLGIARTPPARGMMCGFSPATGRIWRQRRCLKRRTSCPRKARKPTERGTCERRTVHLSYVEEIICRASSTSGFSNAVV